jgi:alpha-beta hydrolase superfamily lysophospholipase
MSGGGRGLIVFVHGLWMHAESWQPWVELFERNGYDCVKVTWPGEGPTVADCRANPQLCVGSDAYQVARQVSDLTRRLDRAPIVVGAGEGAAFAEIALDERIACAAIELTPTLAPCSGPIAINALRRWPGWGNLVRADRPVMPSQDRFHRVFANTVARVESDRLHSTYVVPGVSRPLLGLRRHAGTGRPYHLARPPDRGPLLLISGGRDVCTPEAGVSALHGMHRRRNPDAATDYQVFPGRGHSMAIDRGWQEIAHFCLDWLTAQNL